MTQSTPKPPQLDSPNYLGILLFIASIIHAPGCMHTVLGWMPYFREMLKHCILTKWTHQAFTEQQYIDFCYNIIWKESTCVRQYMPVYFHFASRIYCKIYFSKTLVVFTNTYLNIYYLLLLAYLSIYRKYNTCYFNNNNKLQEHCWIYIWIA